MVERAASTAFTPQRRRGMAGAGLPRQGQRARSSSPWSTARSTDEAGSGPDAQPRPVRRRARRSERALGPAPGRDGDDRGRRLRRRRRAACRRARLAVALADLRAGKPAEGGEELREYGIGAQILAALGIHDMILLTNTHHSPVGLPAMAWRSSRSAPSTWGLTWPMS